MENPNIGVPVFVFGVMLCSLFVEYVILRISGRHSIELVFGFAHFMSRFGRAQFMIWLFVVACTVGSVFGIPEAVREGMLR